MPFNITFYPALFFINFILTFFIYRYAERLGLISLADERSLHEGKTPTGGGLVIAASFLLVAWLGFENCLVSPKLFITLIGGGMLLAIIGFWDDIKPLPVRVRIASQTIAALWAIYWLGGLPMIAFGKWALFLGNMTPVLTFLAIIWLINLYNFMDGIDGLASMQAITVAGCAAVICIKNAELPQAWLYIALTVIVSGFLFWNWPRARIFMGDVGSGFLGYIFAILLLQNSQEMPRMFWVFTILLGIFILDATLTLLRRIIMGEPFYQPHCTHSYQLLAQKWQSHRKVTLLVLSINLFWLFPCALIANAYPLHAFRITLLALLPILIGCCYIQFRQKNSRAL
jgi:Fuc2NAc and GlcNAc transferase